MIQATGISPLTLGRIIRGQIRPVDAQLEQLLGLQRDDDGSLSALRHDGWSVWRLQRDFALCFAGR